MAFAMVDCARNDDSENLCIKYKVKKYPFTRYFKSGEMTEDEPVFMKMEQVIKAAFKS